MMTFAVRLGAIWFFLLLFAGSLSLDDTLLDERIIQFAQTAMQLQDIMISERDLDYYGLDEQPRLFQTEPDAVIVVKHQGYCHVNFRGSRPTLQDWLQNLNVVAATICTNNDDTVCCSAHAGSVSAYYAPYVQEMEDWVDDCAANYCKNMDDCLVLSGHSQGSAVASVAAVILAQWNPHVLLFAAPRVIHLPCAAIVDSTRWFNFVNTAMAANASILYDITSILLIPGAGSVGHMILFSPNGDPSHLAYLGLDVQDLYLRPNFLVSEHIAGAYLRRTNALANVYRRGDYPDLSGFVDGTLCTMDMECRSGSCRGGLLGWACDHLDLDACAGRRCATAPT